MRLGVDIGGTFTDFVLEGGDRQWRAKVLTTPQAPEEAVLAGMDAILAQAGIAPSDLSGIVHGTTLATNALIERRGAPIAFITTEGHRDTLEMASESRYDQYDLDIEKPPPLVPRRLRFTVRERMAVDGSTLLPLDEAGVRALAPLLDQAGVTAVAIGFLHSYRNPAHEQRAAEILRGLRPGLRISLSSDVSPEIREYERFVTACVNAYVQPVVETYLRRLQAALERKGVRAPLMIVQSNGGLCEVDVACRYPVRLLESGPAGGAMMAAWVARKSGVDKALLLDIGGTTAKLCFIDDGAPHSARSLEVARHARFKPGSGLPLRFPVIELAEIGAGGGSIARIDALGRLQMGPESAGAEPGPACYGRGGTAATVTDAHLVLGRLNADDFAGGTMRLAPALSEKAIHSLGMKNAATAMLEVVDENMANAAREHAVEVGKSLAGRTLIAIGGAAPLHAARLATLLGMDRVIVPRGAGVGSAIGFLRAPVAFEITQSDHRRLDSLGDVQGMIEQIAQRTRAVVARAAPGAELRDSVSAYMRYRGQGYEVRVPMRRPEDLRAAFEETYRGLYGRLMEGGVVEILGWTVRTEAGQEMPEPRAAGNRSISGTARKFADPLSGEQVDGRVVDDAFDGVLKGPALIVSPETTVVVPAGFEATRSSTGDVHLRRMHAQRSASASAEIRTQVMWSRLISVVEEQARTLMRTAFSPTVREAGDLSAGVFDLQGRMLAQAITGTPGHVNSMASSARHFLARHPVETMREGDHFITNDPWLTSGHLHDVTVLSPVFRAGRAVGFFACTCHQVDIGGLGQGPDGRSVYEEGLYLPILRIARDGVLNEDVLDIVRANVRQPGEVVGDILSYVVANETSARRLNAMLDEFGEANLDDLGETIIERSRRAMVEAISRLPRGTFTNEMTLDGYDRPVEIRCAMTVAPDRVRVTFDGSSPASAHGINLVLNYTRAYAAFGLRTVVGPEIPNNFGSLSPIEIDAPAGSILNVQHPRPVCARHIIGQFLPEVVLGCLAKALPGRIPAEGAACNWGLQLRGDPAEPFEILFFNAGGSGARPRRDGLSATAFPSGIRSIPVEVCESAAPIVIWRKELLPDSGGAGRMRGGLGQRVEVATRSGAPFQVFGIFDRVTHPARGRDGGADGAPGRVMLTKGKALRAMGLQTVPAGEVLRIDVPGGAGNGPAAQRARDAVLEDLREGFITSTDDYFSEEKVA